MINIYEHIFLVDFVTSLIINSYINSIKSYRSVQTNFFWTIAFKQLKTLLYKEYVSKFCFIIATSAFIYMSEKSLNTAYYLINSAIQLNKEFKKSVSLVFVNLKSFKILLRNYFVYFLKLGRSICIIWDII